MIFSLLFFFLFSLTASAQQAILCGQLIDGTGNPAQANQAILIEGERITGIVNQQRIPENYEVTDLREFTVLPGLIDAHVHPLIYGDNYQLNHLQNSSADKALYGLKTVQNWLNEGWTTLRIAGDADVHYAPFAIRDAINQGLFTGPRIYGAGHYISISGGGGDINYLAPEHQVTPDGLIVNGVEEMRKAVRQEIKYGSDWIKLLVTGAFMSAGDNPQNVHFSDEEIKVAIEEANRRGVPVMAHAHSTEGINRAIELGVRSVEHGSFMNDRSIELFLEHEVYLVPTMAVGAFLVEEYGDSEAQSKSVKLHLKYDKDIQAMLSKAIEAGVKIGVGSDNVGFPPGFACREFEELVKLGMTPMQAIEAGTRVNAELLGKENDLGTIEAGKYADIIATRNNPLEAIQALQDVVFVMKGGEVIKPVR